MEPVREWSVENPDVGKTEASETNTQASAGGEFRMIAFSLGGRDYGIDIMKVKEISHEGRFTYVPNTLHYVLGVHNLRGDIIPIIDLRRMFNLPIPEAKEGAEQNILILKLEKIVLGVVVDSINGVMSTSLESVQPPHPLFSDINLRYLSGVVERGGKLFIVLDVDRIFQETAPAPKPTAVKAETAPTIVEKTQDQELRFVCEGLATFSGFHATEHNLGWIERRYKEWATQRAAAGLSVQLRGAEDAREFLAPFYSPCRGELWGGQLRDGFLSLFPHTLTGTFVVWNYGCGRGFDAYSVTCALKAAFPELMLKTWADDVNLVEVASAPTISFVKDRIPRYFFEGGFLREAETGFQFTAAIRDLVIFEYTESLSRTDSPEADLVISRDVISFNPPATQRAILDAFSQKLKTGGLLVLGVNEQVEGKDWRKAEKGGFRAFVKEGEKE
jgi:purine-binding chemotaxis protein CheW